MKGPGSILLIEDDLDDAELTLRALRANGVAGAVHHVQDGVEALDYLLGGAFPLPHLTLLDLKLPKVNGLQVLKTIRSEALTRLIPVVVLSSSNEQRDLVESYQLGANSYIRKPVDFDQFNRSVEQMGLYWLTLNEPPPLGWKGGP